MCFSPQRRAICRHRNFKKCSKTVSFLTFWLQNVLRATAAYNFSTSELQKVLRDRHFFNILTSTCASRYSAVQFFDIRTSKSAPRPSVFKHFDLEMCFAPQRRAHFRHTNVKKCSETVTFLTFWLQDVLRATAPCNFSTSQLQKVVRSWGVLYILTSKCAFRHSGVQFFDISTSKSRPKLRCFVHFDFKMRVSPQRRAIFRHLNFKKSSEADVLCTFWLQNARFATAACNFSTSATSKSRPKLRCFVHFDFKMRVSPQRRAIFRHLNFKKSSEADVLCTFWLQNVRFASAACNFWFLCWARTSAPAALTGLLFDWPDTRIIEKTQHFATSLTFGADVSSFFWLSDYCIFCRLTWLLYCCAFHLLFNSPYCRKFLFKLPSTITSLSSASIILKPGKFVVFNSGYRSFLCVHLPCLLLIPLRDFFRIPITSSIESEWMWFLAKWPSGAVVKTSLQCSSVTLWE